MDRKLVNRTPMLCLCLTLLAPLAAVAGEVLVRNDSIENFSQAYIVGDFVQGEQAGVRLTSPCDGFIVAIQILWLEGTPGHGQSLEEAIHIYSYNPGTFPTPGPELQLMEGPVLTPGYWNEFRYIDENQSIPLNVPIGAGEHFLVTLEFYNPTNVAAGTPSVVRDTDGYLPGRNILYGYIPGFGWRWWDFNGFPVFLAGDIAIRAVIKCPDPTGACCHADGTCTDGVEQADCMAFGDVWTQGKSCSQVTCTARGACCRQGGCLQLVTEAQCAAVGGAYAGHGTNCNSQVCTPGACCIPSTGECILKRGFECDALGGNWQGPGTTCNPNPCPQPVGACCFDEVCIPAQTQTECVLAGGEWVGPGTDCGPPNPCSGPNICRGDLNCDGRIDFGDINPFVLAISNWQGWLAKYPDCPPQNCDINGDGQYGGTNGFGDINPFVLLLSSQPLPIPCP